MTGGVRGTQAGEPGGPEGRNPHFMQEGPGRARGAGAGPWARSSLCLTWVGAPTVWQMVEYKRATLRDEDAPETPVEGGASPDAVEVGKGVIPVSPGPRPGMTSGTPGSSGLPWRVTCPHLRSISGLCARTMVRRFEVMTLHKTG